MSHLGTEKLLNELEILERKYDCCYRQILVLNNRIRDLECRYQRACRGGRTSYRYTLRLQLATTEGMRNMYYEYACRKADELEAVQEQLVEAGVLSDSEEEIDLDEYC